MRRFLLAVALGWVLAGCGAGDETIGGGAGVEHGRQVFNGEVTLKKDNMQACVDCHSVVAGGEAPIGANLSNIGNRAGATVPGKTAEDYLRASIVAPDEYLSGGFQEGIMPRNYPAMLSEQDINDLIAYMLTLKSGQD